MKHSLAFVAAFALLSLGACGSAPPVPIAYCPNVAVLQQASALTMFLPGRSDVAAEITAAKITGVAGSCTLVKKNTILRVTFQAGFSASNGPANNFADLNLPFFVSISQGESIISKSSYNIALDFGGNMSVASATSKPVTVELANVPASAGIDVLIGFQLTPAELDYAAGQPAS